MPGAHRSLLTPTVIRFCHLSVILNVSMGLKTSKYHSILTL